MGLKLDLPTSNEWHVLKGETQYGPYTYEDMIQMMQNKTLFGFDYVWSPHLEAWTALTELPEFSMDRLNRLAEKSDPNSDVFFRRKHDRHFCSFQAYVHDNKTFWTGVVENISLGGALIKMENPLLLPGDTVTVHFRKAGPKEKAFNVTAEILTKRLTKQKIQHDTFLYYAVKFNTVHKDGESQLRTWIIELEKNQKTKAS